MFQKIILFVLCVVCLAHSSQINPKNVNDILLSGAESQPTGLRLLGRVKAKAFYFSANKSNWTMSKDYCETVDLPGITGMKMATFDNLSELEYLASLYEPGYFEGWFWTAARDAHTLKQFVWDDNESGLDHDLPVRFDVGPSLPVDKYLTCGAFYVSNSGGSMTFGDCSNEMGQKLCMFLTE